MLYPLSYEGGARLDPRRNRTQLPILAGGWLVLFAGLDLSGTDTPTDRILDLLLPVRDGQVRLCAAQHGQVADWLVTIRPDISLP